ncbi:MAG: zinc ABC transporter substrate-binding protein [Candidatus Marinimicrobia bacterium]|nr:zinc ABC transporter substrate-binding protein [Candidatus Neomarinimicrobiota bacterium]
MKVFKVRALLMGIAILLAAGPAAGKKLQIVTTTSDLKAIAEAVGGAYVSVNSISSGRQDPHFIAAKPSYMLRLRKADLFIRIGLELERGWERLILEGSRNRSILLGSKGHLDASAGVRRLEVPTGVVDRSMGDVHPLGNPHYWLDPYNARIIAGTIAQRLGELDPEHEDEYVQLAASFSRQVDTAMFGSALQEGEDAERLWQRQHDGNLGPGFEGQSGTGEARGWQAQMAPFRGVKVVTYHRSWTYFLDRFGLVSAGELEAKPGISPSPGHLKNLIETMQAQQVPIIIVASFKGDKAPNLVASKTGATVVKVPYSVGGNEQASDYIAMMDQLVTRISTALTRSSL